MNQSGNVISGGPVDAGVAGGLPMEPRTKDLEAWRAGIEAKRAKNAAARERLERALASQHAAAVVPRPAPAPEPAPEPAPNPEPEPELQVQPTPEPQPAPPVEPVDVPEPPAPAPEPTRPVKPRPRPAQPRSPHARGPREIPAAALADAVRAYLAGTPLDDLARQHKIGHERMRTLLVDAGVQIRPKTTRGNQRPKVDTKAIAAEYTAGKSAPEIAAERGHSAATIRRALRTEGVELRDDRAGRPRHGARTTFTPEQVAEMAVGYGHGDSLRTIATRYQVNETRVRNALAAAGVPIRPPGNVPDRDTVIPAPPEPDPEPDEDYESVLDKAIAAAEALINPDAGPLAQATEHHLTPTLTALADHLEAVVGLVREINAALNRRPS